jgi:hypothetical protein
MPSTLRINIAGKDANQYVQRNTDDVFPTSYGRTSTIDLPAAAYTATWPTTGETIAYIRLPLIASAYTVNIKTTAADVGWTVSVPSGTSGFIPVLLPKPQTTTYILTASAVATATIIYV